jgi:hypothetical protein
METKVSKHLHTGHRLKLGDWSQGSSEMDSRNCTCVMGCEKFRKMVMLTKTAKSRGGMGPRST